MLVLSRKKGERIVIGDNEIIITVTEVKESTVKLGIEAPSEVRILRSELQVDDAQPNDSRSLAPTQ